jgi:hypothetical protein
MIVAAGFDIAAIQADAPEGEEWWFVADRNQSGFFLPDVQPAASVHGPLRERK